MEMRKSRVLELLRAGKTVFSVKLNSADPRIVEMAALFGIPCIWVDMEHTANDYAITEAQIMAGKINNTDILCRVPRGSYSDYIRPLELDAAGIMAPHVMSAEDARQVVNMTRFYPIGRRPVDGGNADAVYGRLSQAEYNRQANDQRFIVLQIEDPEAMDQIEEIAKVPGYDILFFGPGDYSHAIGHSGEFDHPDVLAGYQKVADAAKKYGKFAGTVTVGPRENAKKLQAMGYRYLNLGSDVGALNQYFDDIANFISENE